MEASPALAKDDTDQLVAVHRDGAQLRIVRTEAQHTELHRMLAHLIGDAAGKRALHRHLKVGVASAKGIQHRQQVQAGVLIGRNVKTTKV